MLPHTPDLGDKLHSKGESASAVIILSQDYFAS